LTFHERKRGTPVPVHEIDDDDKDDDKDGDDDKDDTDDKDSPSDEEYNPSEAGDDSEEDGEAGEEDGEADEDGEEDDEGGEGESGEGGEGNAGKGENKGNNANGEAFPTADECDDGLPTPPGYEDAGNSAFPTATIVDTFITPPPKKATSPNKSGNQRAKDTARLEHHLRERHNTISGATALATFSGKKSYADTAKNGRVKTATTCVSNLACFTKGTNKRANVADYANGVPDPNKKAKCVRTVPDGRRTKLDRPKLVGNANQSLPFANTPVE
jgi:hypothetical protein